MNLNERISSSDFIVKAKIKKIWIDNRDKYLHNIEIEILDLYKGVATKKLKIYTQLDKLMVLQVMKKRQDRGSWLESMLD